MSTLRDSRTGDEIRDRDYIILWSASFFGKCKARIKARDAVDAGTVFVDMTKRTYPNITSLRVQSIRPARWWWE